MKTQVRQGTKHTKPTFPVPGGPYNRTPDRFGNLEEKRCLYIRGNCIPAKQKDKLALPNPTAPASGAETTITKFYLHP